MCDKKLPSVKSCRVHGQRHIGVFVCLCGGFFSSTDTIGKHYKICSTIRSLRTKTGEDRYLFVDEESYARLTRTLCIDNQHLHLKFCNRIPVGAIVETRSVVSQAPVESNTSVNDLRQPVLTLTDCLVNRRISSPATPQDGNNCLNPTGVGSPTSPIGDVGDCPSTPPSGDVDGCSGGVSLPNHTLPDPDTTHPTSDCGVGEVVLDVLASVVESAGVSLDCSADSTRVSPPSSPSQCEKGGVFDGERISSPPISGEEVFSPTSSCMEREMSVGGVSHVTPHTPSRDLIREEEERRWEGGYVYQSCEETPFPATLHLPSHIESLIMGEGCSGEETSGPDVSISTTPLIHSHVEGGNEDTVASMWLTNHNEASSALFIPPIPSNVEAECGEEPDSRLVDFFLSSTNRESDFATLSSPCYNQRWEEEGCCETYTTLTTPPTIRRERGVGCGEIGIPAEEGGEGCNEENLVGPFTPPPADSYLAPTPTYGDDVEEREVSAVVERPAERSTTHNNPPTPTFSPYADGETRGVGAHTSRRIRFPSAPRKE